MREMLSEWGMCEVTAEQSQEAATLSRLFSGTHPPHPMLKAPPSPLLLCRTLPLNETCYFCGLG